MATDLVRPFTSDAEAYQAGSSAEVVAAFSGALQSAESLPGGALDPEKEAAPTVDRLRVGYLLALGIDHLAPAEAETREEALLWIVAEHADDAVGEFDRLRSCSIPWPPRELPSRWHRPSANLTPSPSA